MRDFFREPDVAEKVSKSSREEWHKSGVQREKREDIISINSDWICFVDAYAICFCLQERRERKLHLISAEHPPMISYSLGLKKKVLGAFISSSFAGFYERARIVFVYFQNHPHAALSFVYYFVCCIV